MPLLGFFLLIAEYTNLRVGQERKSKAARWEEGFQRGAELLGKVKVEKVRRREKDVYQSGKYRFKESGIGDSWLIGDDSSTFTNAYVYHWYGCEENLTIPHKLTNESGNTKYVEVIGKYAFYECGGEYFDGELINKGETRSIVLSRYIKVIKTWGLGAMKHVTSFEIEEGSCLERIDSYGLTGMSSENTNEDARSGILVLPSTLTSVAERGLFYNNLIKTIYYCGSTNLSNYSELMYRVSAPDIKVTSSYTYETIFGNYIPKKNKESIAEADEKCKSFGYDLSKNYTSVPAKGGRMVTGWSDGNKHCPPSIDIPEMLEGVTVVAVNESAFSGCKDSRAVSLPPSLKKVGREAFASCGASVDTGFMLTVPSGANISEGSFSNTNIELVLW